MYEFHIYEAPTVSQDPCLMFPFSPHNSLSMKNSSVISQLIDEETYTPGSQVAQKRLGSKQ